MMKMIITLYILSVSLSVSFSIRMGRPRRKRIGLVERLSITTIPSPPFIALLPPPITLNNPQRPPRSHTERGKRTGINGTRVAGPET